MAKGFVKRGPLKLKKESRPSSVYFLGVDTTCLMSIITPSYERAEENLTKVPRVDLRSGPILTANKPRTNREANNLPDMEKNYKKFLSQQ